MLMSNAAQSVLMSKRLGRQAAGPRRLWPRSLAQLVLVATEKQAGWGGRRKEGRDYFLRSKLVAGYLDH